MIWQAALAAVVTAAGVAVALAAWRIQAVLTGVLALLGTAGAAGALVSAAAGSPRALTALALAAAAIGIVAGLLSIGYVFNRLLGREPD